MKSSIVFIVLIVIAVMLSYANSVNNEFVWDDSWLVKNNPHIKSFSNVSKIFKDHLGAASSSEQNNFYRPLQEFSYMIDYFLWGLDPIGYHISSIFFHILLACAVYFLGIKLLNNKIASFIGAIFYAAHPVHTEAVTYIAGRADILGALFFCLSFIFFIKYREKHHNRDNILSIVFFLLSVLSKEASFVFPLVISIYILMDIKKQNKFEVKDIIAPILPYLIISAVYIFARTTVLDFSAGLPVTEIQRSPFIMRCITSMKVFAMYFWVLFLPFNLHMERSVDIPKQFVPFDFIIAVIVIAVFVFLFRLSYKKRHISFFLLAWFFIGLIPVSNIYPINATMAEHWLYLPAITLFLLFGLFVSRVYDKKYNIVIRIIASGVLFAALVFYSTQTVARNRDWKNEKTIYENTLSYSPHAYKVWNNLGTLYNRNEDFKKAIESFRKSIEINDSYYRAYDNLSYSYFRSGDVRGAIKLLNTYIAKFPREIDARLRLGYVYERLGNKAQALEEYKSALGLFPGNPMILARIAQVNSK